MANVKQPIRKDGGSQAQSYSYSYGYGYAGYRKDKRPRRLNKWLLFVTLAVLGIGAPALYLWHDRQINHLSASLLAHADAMATEEKWRDASEAYYRVWEIRKDPKVLGKLATSYDKHAWPEDQQGVVGYYQRAVGAVPSRLDLRARLGELLLKVGQPNFALNALENVLSKAEDTETIAKATKWRALSLLTLHRAGQPLEVDILEELRSAYNDQVGDFDLAFGLIGYLRRDLQAPNNSELGREADAVINSLVEAWPNDANSYLARYQYRSKYGLPHAKQDIDQAILLAPDNALVIKKGAWDSLRSAAADPTRSEADYLTTRSLFQQLIELEPKDPSGYLGLGDVEYLVKGDIEEAIEVWKRGREQTGDSLPLLLRIAEGQTNLFLYEEAEQTIADVKQFLTTLTKRGSEEDRNWATASTALFNGKIKLAQNQPFQAIPEFQRAASLGADPSSGFRVGMSTAFSALMSLGKTYAKLGQMKNAAASYDQALVIQPESETALLAAADSWASLGDLDRAIGNVERALHLPNASGRVRRYLAQYLLEQQIAKPHAERNWTQFEEAFQKARWQLADSWRLRLIDVDYAMRRTDKHDVSTVLGKLLSVETDFPEEIQVWRRLPFIYETIGSEDDADRAMNRLEEITSSSPESKFVLIDVLLSRGKFDEAQVVLEGIAEAQLTPQEEWLRDLAQLRVIESLGHPPTIDSLLDQLIAKYPMNESLVERYLDRRLCGSSTATTPTNEELLATLKQRQQTVEPNWQYFAARLELASEQPELSEVRSFLSSLQNRLPYWSRTQELAGRLAELEGNDREARVAFEEALTKPHPNPELIHLLIGDYLASSDYVAAIELAEMQKERAPLSRLLTEKWSDLQEQLDFSFVSQGVRHETPAHELLWNQITGDADLAEFAKSHPTSVLAALSSLESVTNGELPSNLRTRVFANPDERAFVFGQAYELMGKYREARQSFNRVSESSPYRLKASHYVGLANIRQKASRANDGAEFARGSSERLEAILLLRRAGKNDLPRARQLLETLVSSPEFDLNDRRLLALCLEKLDEPEAAREQLESVVNTSPSAQNLAALIDFLLRNGEEDASQSWLEQLEVQAGWSRASIGLRTRWMAVTDRRNEIKPLVELFAQKQFQRNPDDVPAEIRAFAAIYRDVNMLDEAKRWLSILANRFPDEAEPLSFLLLENDETENAIQRFVEQLNKRPNAKTASLLAKVLVYGDVTRETMNQVQPLLEESLGNFPDEPSLLFAMGNLRLKQGNPDAAIDLLARVTEVRPGHYYAWNNLAALLAEQPGRQQEALDTIEKAIGYAVYDIPTLYDTKAVVLMHGEQFEQAAELLSKEVVNSRAIDPRFFFHLAMSYERLGKLDKARQVLAEADDLNLDTAFLTKFETDELTRLRSVLAE